MRINQIFTGKDLPCITHAATHTPSQYFPNTPVEPMHPHTPSQYFPNTPVEPMHPHTPSQYFPNTPVEPMCAQRQLNISKCWNVPNFGTFETFGTFGRVHPCACRGRHFLISSIGGALCITICRAIFSNL